MGVWMSQRARLSFVVAFTALVFVSPAGIPAGAAAKGTSACHRNVPPILRDGFPNPEFRYSRNGRLDVNMLAAPGKVRIDGKPVWTRSFNHQFPGPALMVCAGDRLRVNLKNRLKGQPTNFHTHGFHVSPRGHHDNVYVNLDPGKNFRYEYSIPRTNPAGAYWYHPHRHHFVDSQIFAGMSGAIIQEGGLDRLPAFRDIPQRIMVLQNTQVKDGKVVPVNKANAAKEQIFVNGSLFPTAKIRPGELQRWRILNNSADRMMVLKLEDQPFWVLAQDGATLRRPRVVRRMKLAPGQRREVLVRGAKHGRYVLEAAPFKQFPGPVPKAQPFMFVQSQGEPVAHRQPIPQRLGGHFPDLRKEQPERYRKIVYSEEISKTETDFFLNGQMFNPHNVLTMKLNSLEQWKLVNTTNEWHTFHIHINDFQVIRIGGKPQPYVNYQDNVMIPPNSSVVIRQRPTQFTGKFVFHCHVVFHEDHGMMMAVRVAKNPTAGELAANSWQDGELTVASSAYGSSAVPGPAVDRSEPPALVTDGFPARHDVAGRPWFCRLGLTNRKT